MFELVMVVFRALWPFLKESILSGQTPREWMRQNKTTFAWVIIHITMLIAVTNLAGLVLQHRKELAHTRTMLNESVAEHSRLLEVHMDLKQRYEELKDINARLTVDLDRHVGENSRLNQILRACNVNVTPTSFQCPRAPKPAPPPPRHTPVTPAVTEEKIPLSERLRAIFRRKKD